MYIIIHGHGCQHNIASYESWLQGRVTNFGQLGKLYVIRGNIERIIYIYIYYSVMSYKKEYMYT